MFAWFSVYGPTILTVLILLALTGLAVFSIVRDKKRKTGGCTGNCATCGMACCRKQQK